MEARKRRSMRALALLYCFTVLLFLGGGVALAGNMSNQPSEHWAWNDAAGWIDFTNVTATPPVLQGYGTSSAVGDVAMDCATTSIGNICATNNFKVANDGYGNLSGWAWNDAIGWISFWCGNIAPADCQSSNYQVTIDGAGDFHGWAWNDSVGWLSFNCDHSGDGGTNQCGMSSYKLKTTYVPGLPAQSGVLTSSIFDAGDPVALNFVLWKGTLNGLASTAVRFRIASSNCVNGKTNPPACNDAGDWQYLGPNGSTTDYYVPSGPNAPSAIDTRDHNNVRYYRYRIFMDSDVFGNTTPEVTDVIINWSP
ncbi:MAG: hypothetical protein HYZ07_00385 [Candidatus Harrisonbacteria bacterium]|nr:hypothetical protein [Candidatus Harrisonbacteria bacterium]